VKLTARAKEEPEVNMTSLIDVVLLLLIFFMVSTRLACRKQTVRRSSTKCPSNWTS